MKHVSPFDAVKQFAQLAEDIAVNFGHDSGYLMRDAQKREERKGTPLQLGDCISDFFGFSARATYERHLRRSSQYRGMVNPYNDSPFKRQR